MVVGLPVRRYDTFGLSINRPGDLDLWPWNWCALLFVAWATLIPILVFLELFLVDLQANTCRQMDHVTLSPWRSWRLPVMRLFMLQLYTNFEISMPSNSADMTHFRHAPSAYLDLDLWPLTITACVVGNIPTNFGVSATFRSWLTVWALIRLVTFDLFTSK